ncbi:autotransporter assembly complex protein TamA [Thalassococcus sp. BH17M4-6]|uniref:autotransporter assembly complex protein TamA n=1 Tax=Thalassococcus sp. BH17M4-6 TaxID=3413148 RepID=UPI003BE5A438
MGSRFRAASTVAVLSMGAGLPALPAAALESVEIRVTERSEELRELLKAASTVKAAQAEDQTTPNEVFAAALAEYGRMTETLYANGYYGGTVDVFIDGRQASEISLLQLPQQISDVTVVVDPGPRFKFGQAVVEPLAPETALPEGFRTGERARSGVVGEAVDAAVTGWRDQGFAKARTTDTSVTARHIDRKLDVDIRVAPGPRVQFGKLKITSDTAVKHGSIRRIAGLPEGEVFSPATLETAAQRLRRTGTFASVNLQEGEVTGPNNTMDINANLVDQKPRRFGFGAEISSLEGLSVSSFWLHRNFLGGAERLRIDGEVSNIGSSGDNGMDYSLGARLEVPAIYGPETLGFVFGTISYEDEPTYLSQKIELGIGATRRFNEYLTVEASISFLYSETEDDLGDREFTLLQFPVTATYDRRNNELNPTSGYYAQARLTPYAGLDGSQSGARLYADLRGYLDLGQTGENVLAGRFQLGSIMGSDLAETYPEYLFTSGGGGTVRGQPYKSLDIDLGGGDSTGGRSFVGFSAEFRRAITDTLGIVAFADTGYIGAESFYDGTGEWHSGAGLGLRYNTGIGPIRFDVAGPVGGETGDGVQIYIGIGQAF